MLQVGNDLVKATGIWVTGGLGFSTKKFLSHYLYP